METLTKQSVHLLLMKMVCIFIYFIKFFNNWLKDIHSGPFMKMIAGFIG